MKLAKMLRAIQFKQKSYVKDYIDLNTALRAESNYNFEKDFFKFLHNSIFEKTMGNIRKRVNLQLPNEKKSLKSVAKPNFEKVTIFNKDIVAVHMKRTKLVYNKPVYLGMCILDISKTLMYDFQYNVI